MATVALVATGCGSSDAAGTSDGDDPAVAGGGAAAVSIVVTTSILGDIVDEATAAMPEGAVDVEVIMPIGTDPHEFAPSAKQAETMERADVLVVNGLGLEEQMSGIIDTVGGRGVQIFVVADHLGLEPDTIDPHIWMDPTLMVRALDALEVELVEAGVEAAALAASIDAYEDRLVDLDAAIASTLAPISPDNRVMVTNHDAFEYFARRYDISIVGTIIPSFTTDAEATASQLEDLAALVRSEGIPAIFAETSESDRLARSLAAEVGGPVEVVELFSGSLGEPGSGADIYVGMMTTNADLIVAALT